MSQTRAAVRSPAVPSPGAAEPTLGALVAAASRDLSALVRAEVELAKAEIRDDVRHAAVGGGMFGAAGLFGFLASVLLSFALAAGLVELGLDAWLALLVAGAAYLLLAGGLALVGARRVKRVQPPNRAIESTRESVAVLRGARRR